MIRPFRLFPLLGLLAVAVAVPASAGAVPRSDRHAHGGEGLRPFDAREGRQAPVPASVRRAARDARRALGRQGFVQLDEQSGSPNSIVRTDGYLTGASQRDPAAIALGYVRGHATLFGLSDAEVDDLQVTRRYAVDGVTHLQWRQVHDGIPVLDQGLQAAVGRDGRLVTIGGAPLRDASIPSTTPGLSAGEALAAARRDASAGMVAPRAAGGAGPTRATTFANGDTASLVVFGDPRGNRLAWRLLVHKSSTEVYDAVVDADSGRILRRNNMVKFANAHVWDYAPNVGTPGGTPVTFGPPWLNPGAITLNGPNAHVVSDVDDHISGPGPVKGVILDADEIDATTDFPAQAGLTLGAGGPFYCPTSGCSWNPQQVNMGQPDSWTNNVRQNAAQVFYFLNTYHDHLAASPINFGNGLDNGQWPMDPDTGAFNGNDPIIAQVDDGANTASGLPDADHVNNANMATYPDGTPGYMQMYLWKSQPPKPGDPGTPWSAVNGGDDAAVVYHEYTHGLSNRLVTYNDGYGALNSFQAGAMGEAWSDFYALDFLVQQGAIADNLGTPGEVKMGVYEDGGNDLLRTQALDCKPGDSASDCPGSGTAGSGGYTYGDLGKMIGMPEVHADGEIWGETLWQIRWSLGPTLAERLITDGMRFLPPEPSMLDARNALLVADTVDNAGNAHAALWAIFKQRGMGYFASALGSWDTHPTEDFSSPPNPAGGTGDISGTLTDARTGVPLAGATVSVGGHATYASSPYGDNFVFDATDATGAYELLAVPNGPYPALIARADGYSRAEQSLTVLGNGTRNIQLERNWASTRAGATVTAFTDPKNYPGCAPAQAADQEQGTTWSTTTGGPRSVTINLPANVDMSAYAVDPGAGCGDDERSSAKAFKLEVSTDGTAFTQVDSGDFTAADNHRLTRRPLSQIQTQVRYVRLTISSAQGSTSDFMDVSDIEVYGAPSGAPPATLTVPTPTPTPTPTPPTTPRTLTNPPSGPAPRSVAAIARDVKLSKATSRGVTVSTGGVATMTVTFPSEIPSQTGTATLTVSGSGARAAKTTTIGSVRFKVRKGKVVRIRVTLTKSGRKLLARRKRLTVRLRMTVKDSLGRRVVATRTVKLKASAKHKRRR